MIPKKITSRNILSGIMRVDKEGYPSNRKSEDYDLWFQGKLYPPKVIVSYSHYAATKVDYPPSMFNGGEESNEFLMDRGFPILVKMENNTEDFFTKQDVYFFNKVINENYQSNNSIDQNKANYIKHFIWRRSKQWANLIAESGTFKVSGGTRWNDRKGKNQGYKKYSWYKLHLTSNFHTQIFYTVGVDGIDKTLVIKLDCLREGIDKLYVPFQQYFDSLKSKRGIADWRIFNYDELSNLTWNQLIHESQIYISQTLQTYNDIITYIKSNRIKKYARICWNDFHWTRPSGFSGKSNTSQLAQNFIHERENGFAPEEWLFDLEKLISGYHYARIEPVNTKNRKHVDHIYDIIFYSFNGVEKKWFWIAEIQNVEVINKEKSIEIYGVYKQRKWLAEQQLQLEYLKKNDNLSLDINVESFKNWEAEDLFNIRFKPEDAKIHPEIVPFSDDEAPPSNHYNLPDVEKLHKIEILDDLGGLTFSETDDSETDSNPDITTIRRNYSYGLKELINVHYDLQKAFIKFLKKEYPNDKIGKECVRKDYNTRVDVVRQTKNGFIFYEIKTYPDVLTSVRTAIGQLLEYQYYPNQVLAIQIVIVTHLKGEKIIYDYLTQLENQIGIRIGLICFDYKTQTIINQSPFLKNENDE